MQLRKLTLLIFLLSTSVFAADPPALSDGWSDSNTINLRPDASVSMEAESHSARKEISFNSSWKFMKGKQENAEAIEFDGSKWQAVHLPHDWAIAGPFDPLGNGSTGKLPWQGVAWYRKSVFLNQANIGKRFYFNFDGVMAFPTIYINGQLAGKWDYGYTPFWIDATDYLKFGQENVIAILVDTRRWYPGVGIYRDVTMVVTDHIHIEHWGTFISTPYVSKDKANVKINNTIKNHLDSDSLVDITVSLFDPDGKEFLKKSTYLTVPAGGDRALEISFPIHNPYLWDITSPDLYRAKTILKLGGKIVDSTTSVFGIRSYEFTPDDGFFLNGHRVALQGVNLHHDLGPLGSAFNRRAMERELEIMREMGVNAIRTSHNPPARGTIELCDRMGLFVVNEAFDKWDGTAGRVNDQPSPEEYAHRHLRNFVMRDRNSPSVILWSIGNEIWNNSRNNPGSGKSPESVTFMSDFVRDYDSTRPVTMGCDKQDTANEPILDALDVVGYNYGRRYEQFRINYPQMPLMYSESASTVSTRGFYSFPFPANRPRSEENEKSDSNSEKPKQEKNESVPLSGNMFRSPETLVAQNNYSYDKLVETCKINTPKWDLVDCQYWALSKKQYHGAYPDEIWQAMSGTMRTEDALTKISVHALILKADASPEQHKVQGEAVRVMPKGKLVHIDRAGHNLHHDELERTREVLAEFLSSL